MSEYCRQCGSPYPVSDACEIVGAASAVALSSEKLSLGTSVCDICGNDAPHHHDAELVEIERFVRPAFEKTTIPRSSFGRINKHPSIPYIDGGTEQLWQHFISGWFASSKALAAHDQKVRHE